MPESTVCIFSYFDEKKSQLRYRNIPKFDKLLENRTHALYELNPFSIPGDTLILVLKAKLNLLRSY